MPWLDGSEIKLVGKIREISPGQKKETGPVPMFSHRLYCCSINNDEEDQTKVAEGSRR